MKKIEISPPFIPRGFGNRPSPEQAVVRYDNGGICRGNLLLWHEKYFTNPVSWSSGQPFRFIVHTLSSPKSLLSDDTLFSTRGKALSQWDTVSASLISDQKPFTYGSIGVVLRVPYQNIVTTHHADLMFRNNIGDIKRQDFDHMERKSNLADIPPWVRNGMLSEEINKTIDTTSIHSPDEILRKTYYERNELVIVTRPGINIHPGFPATQPVEVIAAFKKDMRRKAPSYWGDVINTVCSSAEKNRWPVLDIPGPADVEPDDL